MAEENKIHDAHLIRLHEKIINSLDEKINMVNNSLERRITAVEGKIDKIPWILVMVMLNVGLSLFTILMTYFRNKGGP